MSELTQTSVKDQNKIRGSHKFYPYLLLAIAVLGSVLLFLAYWESNSVNETFQTQTGYQYLNGSQLVTKTSTITIDNYYPLISRDISAAIMKRITYAWNETPQTITIENSASDLKAENITIEQITWKRTYGDTELSPPLTITNPATLPRIGTGGMSRNTITISWKYKVSETNGALPYVYYLMTPTITQPTNNFSLKSIISKMTFWLPSLCKTLVISFVFDLLFAAAGFVFSRFALRDKSSLKEAFQYLKGFNVQKTRNLENVARAQPFSPMARKQSENQLKELKRNLETLEHSPNRLGTTAGITLGLSILFFKASIANLCKRHRDDSALLDLKTFEDEFSKYLKSKETTISDLIPEKETILILTGFFTSVGISFSFNMGALAPFLFSVGVFYAFLNIGSAFYIFRKSVRDELLVLFLFAVAWFVVSLPALLEFLRVLI